MRPAVLGGALAALLLPSTALAHVTVLPTYLENGTQSTLVFSAPNERAPHAVMQLTVAVPSGVVLAAAPPPPGWKLDIAAGRATWRGGRTGPAGRFSLLATSDRSPAELVLVAVQRYDDGARVRWTIPITILPARETPKQHLWPAFVAGAVGLALTIGALVFLQRRREATSRRPP